MHEFENFLQPTNVTKKGNSIISIKSTISFIVLTLEAIKQIIIKNCILLFKE